MMPLAIAGSVITGGASLLGNVLGFGSQAATNAANMELAKYQYEKNLEMWHRNNEYNSPQAQMQRLKNAGLNPNLVYGNGAVGNASSTPPQFEAPTMQAYTNFGDLGASAGVDAYMRSRMVDADINNREADTYNKELEAAIKNYQIETQYLDFLDRAETFLAKLKGNQLTDKEISWFDRKSEASVNNIVAQTENIREMISFRNEFQKPLTLAQIENYVANTAFTKGPRTAQAYASAEDSRASAASKRFETQLRADARPELLNELKNRSAISDNQAMKLYNEVNIAAQNYNNLVKQGKILDYQQYCAYWDALIKKFTYEFKLPMELVTDAFDSAAPYSLKKK